MITELWIFVGQGAQICGRESGSFRRRLLFDARLWGLSTWFAEERRKDVRSDVLPHAQGGESGGNDMTVHLIYIK